MKRIDLMVEVNPAALQGYMRVNGIPLDARVSIDLDTVIDIFEETGTWVASRSAIFAAWIEGMQKQVDILEESTGTGAEE